jgi:hypothetical protein
VISADFLTTLGKAPIIGDVDEGRAAHASDEHRPRIPSWFDLD